MARRQQKKNSAKLSPLLRYILTLIAVGLVVGLSLYFFLQQPAEGVSSEEVALELDATTPPPNNYVEAEELKNQFNDCLEVTAPGGGILADLLPPGEYREFAEKFDRSIRTASALSVRSDNKIGACTGIDRLYELKKLIEQRCGCKLDITCNC